MTDSVSSFGLIIIGKEVRLGVAGLPSDAEAGFKKLTKMLDQQGVKWHEDRGV